MGGSYHACAIHVKEHLRFSRIKDPTRGFAAFAGRDHTDSLHCFATKSQNFASRDCTSQAALIGHRVYPQPAGTRPPMDQASKSRRSRRSALWRSARLLCAALLFAQVLLPTVHAVQDGVPEQETSLRDAASGHRGAASCASLQRDQHPAESTHQEASCPACKALRHPSLPVGAGAPCRVAPDVQADAPPPERPAFRLVVLGPPSSRAPPARG